MQSAPDLGIITYQIIKRYTKKQALPTSTAGQSGIFHLNAISEPSDLRVAGLKCSFRLNLVYRSSVGSYLYRLYKVKRHFFSDAVRVYKTLIGTSNIV